MKNLAPFNKLNEMNLFILLCTVQTYLKFKLSFFYKYKKYFKKVHGQHEKWPVRSTVPQNNLIKKDQF